MPDVIRSRSGHLLASCASGALAGGAALCRIAATMALSACALAGAGFFAAVALLDPATFAAVSTGFGAALREHPSAVVAPLLLFSALPVAFAVPSRFGASIAANATGLAEANRRDREMTARHEAAHALVASVLGVPFDHALVHRSRLAGIGGRIAPVSPARAHPPADACGSLVRKVAVLVAGVCGTRDGEEAICFASVGGEKDEIQARALSWAAADFAPGRDLFGEVCAAVRADLGAASWGRAVAAGADLLLEADGEPVPADAFAGIARRFGLALPAVEAVALRPEAEGP